MKQIPVKLGPMALLLTVVSICLTVLSILTFSTARADVRLAERYAEMITKRYALMDEGQQFLDDAGRLLSEKKSLDSLEGVRADAEGTVWFEKKMDDMTLTVGIVPDGSSYQIKKFTVTKEWSEDLDIGDLWTGAPGMPGTAGLPGGGSTGTSPGVPGMPGF